MMTAPFLAYTPTLYQPHLEDEREPDGMIDHIFGIAGCIDAPSHIPAGCTYRYECKYGAWDMPKAARRER